MPVNNISAQVRKYIQKPTNIRKFVTHLNKAGVLLPVVLLETTVTGGRTYQAYKRGGMTEARERLCEESVGAVFWLFGVKFFNEVGNWIGKKYLGIENPKFSLAKDAVRHPFENMIRDKKLDAFKKKLVAFKFTKVAMAVLLAGGTLGFVVPKINQAITKKMLKNDAKKQQKNENENIKNIPISVKPETMQDFVERTGNSDNPSFKGISIDKFVTLTNNLENHDIYKLLSTDVGVLAGRSYNARNKDERIEIIFRDGASIYFYLLCKDHVIKLMQKFDGFGGKLSKLDPTTAMATHNTLVEQMVIHEKKNNGYNPSLSAMKTYVFGSNPELVDQNLAKIKFKTGDIIALEDFETVLKDAGIEVDSKMLNKAKAMSSLQPERELSDIGKPKGKVMALLTRQQVRDVLNDGVLSRPSFIKKVMKETFNGQLSDSYSFIPRETIETLRQNIDDYVKVIIEYAEKNNIEKITPDLLLKINKKNFLRNALNIGSGLGVSALFLSTIIPKIQYWITEKRTGSKEFPGVKNINQ